MDGDERFLTYANRGKWGKTDQRGKTDHRLCDPNQRCYMLEYIIATFVLVCPVAGLRSRSRSWSRSRPESVVLTGVGVGVGVGKFSSTPTPARSRSRLQHFLIISFLFKMETERFVLTADSPWFAMYACTALLSLGLRLFSDELAFNHTSRLDHHNRQRHSLWGPVTWPCLINFGGVTGWKRSLENSDVLCRKSYWPGGAGHGPLFSIHI